jgi:undecaprenyl diphosphate synthase
LNSNATEIRPGLDPDRLPRHVAVIMDGNGRWAKKRFLNRVKGHEKGAETVRAIVRVCRELGIAHLTLYAFSTENWNRPQAEISALMTLLKNFLVSERPDLMKQQIRLNAIGQIERLPDDVREALFDTVRETGGNDGMIVHLALSYGGRSEIVRMVRQIAEKARTGRLAPESIDEIVVADHLYTQGVPDPDIMIRTSGEMRISNFLLWQIAYSEIFVTDTLWPDFGEDEFLSILKEYQSRDRRFGKV